MKKHTLRFLILSGLFSVVLGAFGWSIYVEKEQNWFEARDYCRRHHTDLSSIHTESEMNKLLESRHWNHDVWTGFHQTDSGVWKWSGGKRERVNITSTTDKNRCAIINHHGWHMRNCTTEKFRFFCFQSRLVLVKENKTWEEAMEHCQSLGKNLVGLHSKTDLTQFMQSCREAQTKHVWTGLRFLAGKWLWLNGRKVNHWAYGPGVTPQCPEEDRRCGALSLKEQNLVSQDCANKFSFVCN